MSESTDASVCYGISFEEGFEFPWSNYDDFDDWYLTEVLKFKYSFEIYNKDGEYIDGKGTSREVVKKYYKEKEDFIAANPICPVEVFTHCHYDCRMYIIGIRGTKQTASRGHPEVLKEITKQDPSIITDFCKKYRIKYNVEPAWLLYSYFF